MKKPKKPSLSLPKVSLTRPVLRRRKTADERMDEAFANVPRITNETVAEHREAVLGGARKFIYPLKHSRRRAVMISSSIFIAAIVLFLAYSAVALYKFQSTSGFMYGVSEVIPFPVAKAGSSWVSYESYLFELRHYMHYYASQQGVNFDDRSGKAQLANYKKQALNQVIQDAYVKQLASKNHVSVSDRAVDQEVALVRNQNRLGTSQREFDEVLNEFWGWNETDFKRDLKQQLLAQAVVAKLDTGARDRATQALAQLQNGADFGTLATQVSDDAATKTNAGQYGAPIAENDPNFAPQVTGALFSLQPGQTSQIIETSYGLEILKVLSAQDGKVTAAHIEFDFQPITNYTQPQQAAHRAHRFIKV